MIFFKNSEAYGKVWKITKNEKYLDVQMTTSEKDTEGNYVNSRWFPRIIGHAFNSLKDILKEGDRIVITKAKFSNESYAAKDGTTKSAFRFLILEANLDEPKKEAEKETAKKQEVEVTEDKDDCPW